MEKFYFRTPFHVGVGHFAHEETVALEGKVEELYDDNTLRGRLIANVMNLGCQTVDFEVDSDVTELDFNNKISGKLAKKIVKSFLKSSIKERKNITLVGVYYHSDRKEDCKLQVYRIWLGNETLGLSSDYFRSS